MKIENADGINWVEPNHVKVSDLRERLMKGESVQSIKLELLGDINDNHWNTIANAIFAEWKKEAKHLEGADALVNDLNQKLSQYALAFPVYGTLGEVKELQIMLQGNPPDVESASRLIFHIIMQPRMRALQLVGRFNKIQLFAEFSYFIESATIAYYRGNVVSSFLSIVPVIEGILLRWQGYPDTLAAKPDFEKTKKFIGKSIYRQPVPRMPTFFESYVKAADEIFKNHLYRNSTDGRAHGDFNRHLALHMLEN